MVPLPIWPTLLKPQQRTAPLLSNAQAPRLFLATDTAVVSPDTVTGACDASGVGEPVPSS